jgi:oligopeptide/dipeptide ABC transporter ATP-binding protein
MTVGRQLAGTVRLLDPDVEPTTRSRELLDAVEMPNPDEVLSSYPHQLSGGMRQRAMIALAIAGRPELLIADEPTTALDVTVQRSVLNVLGSLCRGQGMGLVLVTHDLGIVASISDQVAVMYAGMTVEVGPTAAVLHDPRHPYTRALLGAQPSNGIAGKRLVAIAGSPPSPEAWPSGCRFAPRCPHQIEMCTAQPVSPTKAEQGQMVRCARQFEVLDG